MPPTGLRFRGAGHAAVNTRAENAFHFADKFDINLKFKTFSDTGLLFLIQQSAVSSSVIPYIKDGV